MIREAALLVAVSMGRPIFVAQTRPGHHERRFVVLKFRTMSDRRRADGELLPGAERLGRLGRFLRASSLDELPELVNVLRGDMALSGLVHCCRSTCRSMTRSRPDGTTYVGGSRAGCRSKAGIDSVGRTSSISPSAGGAGPTTGHSVRRATTATLGDR